MKRILMTVCTVVLALCGQAQAQSFPARNVTMVIPFPAGAGANDVLGRFVAERLQRLWGRAVVVENRPGANATIGAVAVVRARPDGHTMLFTSANYTMTPAVVVNMPFDAAADLKPAAMLGMGEYLLVTGPHANARNVQEFIAEGRRREMVYAGGTPGADIAAGLFMQATGIRMLRVPYGGTNTSMIDLLGGRIDFVVAAVGAQVDNIAQGKVIALAVTGANRSAMLPNVPSMREQGFASGELPTWWSILVPSATPDDVVATINASVARVLQEEETQAFFARQSVVPTSMSPPEISALMRREIDQFRELVRTTGLQRE
jgi:tripartite-type tricarboxylate transporter receptor subunit TctC